MVGMRIITHFLDDEVKRNMFMCRKMHDVPNHCLPLWAASRFKTLQQGVQTLNRILKMNTVSAFRRNHNQHLKWLRTATDPKSQEMVVSPNFRANHHLLVTR